MPMGTLELPRNMIDAATSYADRESVSVVDLFANLLHRQYGYVLSVQVIEPSQKERKAVVPEAVAQQRAALLKCVGTWKDDRTTDEIIADIEGHRTRGREVNL